MFMALSRMLCVRNFLFILMAGLCVSEVANRQHKKLSVAENRHSPGNLDFMRSSRPRIIENMNDEQYKYIDVRQHHASEHPLSKNGCHCHQAKISSFGIDQTPSGDGSYRSTIERKTLTVRMKPQIYDNDRGLMVYDSGNLIYQTGNYTDQKQSKKVLLMDATGKVVFTIRRKIHEQGISSYVGYRGLEGSASSSKHDSFLVHDTCYCFFQKQHSSFWGTIYDNKRYNLYHCMIEKSSNAKIEFTVVNAEGRMIAELKQKHLDGRGVRLGQDMLNLEVELEANVSFVVALVTIFGMMNDII